MTTYKSKCPICAKLVEGYRAPGNSRMVKFDCCNLSWARPMFMEPEPSDPADDVAVRIGSLTLALTRAEKAEADNAALLQALRDYGEHCEDCPTLHPQDDGGDGECECGMHVAAEPHPGAVLLERLEEVEAALRVQSQMLEATQKERDEARTSLQTERDADDANRRSALESAGLLEEFGVWGCDSLQHVADSLVSARRSRDEARASLAAVNRHVEQLEAADLERGEALAALEKAGWPCRLAELPGLYRRVCEALRRALDKSEKSGL